MKKVWKWVIGIVIVLVIVAALVVGGILLRNHFATMASIAKSQPGIQLPNDYGTRYPGMRPFRNDGWEMHGMRGPGWMGFSGMMLLGGLFRGLFSLGLLALVVLGIIWLARRLKQPAGTPTFSAPAAPTVVAVAEPIAPVASIVTANSCPKCGETLQEGWKHCPNCGKKIKSV
jgi:hypothetical protein